MSSSQSTNRYHVVKVQEGNWIEFRIERSDGSSTIGTFSSDTLASAIALCDSLNTPYVPPTREVVYPIPKV